MIVIKDISKHYSVHTVLREVNLQVGLRDRMALIGGNGSGKSTLLKIIAGQLEPSAGTVDRPRELSLGYLPQSGLSHRGRSLWEEMLTALPEWMEMKKKRRELLDKITRLSPESPEHQKCMLQYGEMESLYQQEDGYAQESRLKRILGGLGFLDDDLHRQVDTFSSGWQMRIGLGKLLVREPDFMLLDEPTDHLDLDAKNWLEEYLKGIRIGFLLVSHDRHFLDNVIVKVAEIQNNEIAVYNGNYTRFLREKDQRADALQDQYEQQQKQIQRMENFIARNRARKDKARQVQSRIHRLDMMERVQSVRKQETMRFLFPAPSRAPRLLVELEEMSKSYSGKPLFRNLNMRVERGERIAVVGPNGAGKSTILRILAGKEKTQEGIRLLGERVSVGWFSQDMAIGFGEGEGVLDILLKASPLLPQDRARGLLAKFGFPGDHVFKSVGALSGGERVRLALARLLLNRHHLLLLDEPTNHLDIRGRQALLDALLSYSGTLVFVSHDRYFIQELAGRIIEIRQGVVRSLSGGYEDYLTARDQGTRNFFLLSEEPYQQERQKASVPEEDLKKKRIRDREHRKAQKREEQKRQRQLVNLEEEIEALERERKALEEQMADPSLSRDFQKLQPLHERFTEIQNQLTSKYASWDELIQEEEKNSE